MSELSKELRAMVADDHQNHGTTTAILSKTLEACGELEELEEKIDNYESYYSADSEEVVADTRRSIGKMAHLCDVVDEKNRHIKQLRAENEHLVSTVEATRQDLHDFDSDKLHEKIAELKARVDEVKKDNDVLHKRLNDLAEKDMANIGFKRSQDE